MKEIKINQMKKSLKKQFIQLKHQKIKKKKTIKKK